MGSGFTLLFEALCAGAGQYDADRQCGRAAIGEHDTRLWRIVEHYVWRAVEKLDLSPVRRIAADELRRGAAATTSACSWTWRGVRSSTSPTARTRRP